MIKFELSVSETLLILKALAWYFIDDETCSIDKELSEKLIKKLNEQVKQDMNDKCSKCNGLGFVPLGECIRGIVKCDCCNGTGNIQGKWREPMDKEHVKCEIESVDDRFAREAYEGNYGTI